MAKKKRSLRIFLSLVEIAGYYSNLEKGFRDIGINARTGFVVKHHFGYSQTPPSLLQRLLMTITEAIKNAPSPLLNKILYIPLGILMILYFTVCLFRYDVFIFGFKRSFFPQHLDLPLLKLFGKTVIFTFHGSDSRPVYLNGVMQEFTIEQLNQNTRKQLKGIEIIDKYSNHIVTQPAISIFHKRPLINWIAMGIPYHGDDIGEGHHGDQTGTLTILHAPSNPKAKGTFTIRQAIQELKEEGYVFNYREIIGRPHDEVITEIKNCAFVIDQLYSDLHLAGFATEAAYHGKPAIIGGYELSYLAEFLGHDGTAPSYTIQPNISALKTAVIDLLSDKNKRNAIGKAAQKFVKKNWAASYVAGKYLALIRGDINPGWQFNSTNISFIYGCCIHIDTRNRILKEYIERYGDSALCMDHHPKLKKKLLDSL